MSPHTIQNAWQRYKQFNDLQARNELIEHYLFLVKITAGRPITNAPSGLTRDDLVSAGIVGLIKAVDQYDMTRQVKFETYAIVLIRGAILEMLREDDWVPRSTRERVKLLERTYREMEIKLGRPATEDEMAEALDVTLEDFEKMLVETGRTSLLSIEDIFVGKNRGGKISVADVIQDEGITPTVEAELRERERMLGKAIDRLPKRERMVLLLYYYEGFTFKEISPILKMSEARAYQLHTQALLRLRNYLRNEVFDNSRETLQAPEGTEQSEIDRVVDRLLQSKDDEALPEYMDDDIEAELAAMPVLTVPATPGASSQEKTRRYLRNLLPSGLTRPPYDLEEQEAVEIDTGYIDRASRAFALTPPCSLDVQALAALQAFPTQSATDVHIDYEDKA